MKVKTIVYSDSKTLTPEKLQENLDFNERSDGKIIYHQGIVKDMSLFCNQLSENFQEEIER